MRYVCARCGVPVGYWYFGWKHQNGWHGRKSCGLPPIPVPKEIENERSKTQGD